MFPEAGLYVLTGKMIIGIYSVLESIYLFSVECVLGTEKIFGMEYKVMKKGSFLALGGILK